MNDRSDEYLVQMREHADNAITFAEGMRREDFLGDRRTQQAVLMSLFVIGEAASRILERHPEIVTLYPTVPWASIRAMRNRIAHGYMSVDLDVVWNTLQNALPDLLQALADPS